MTANRTIRSPLLFTLLLVLGVLFAAALGCGRNARPTATPEPLVSPTTAPSPTATAVPELPDLVVAIKGPASAGPGQTLGDSIAVEVSNRGNATARNFAVGLYFSTDKTVSQSDALLLGGREFVKSLKPGETITVKLSGSNKLPEGLPEGDHYLGVIVDETDAVEELDEDNNAARWPITIRVALAATSTMTPNPTRTPTPKLVRTSTPTARVSPSPSPTGTGTATPTSTTTATHTPTLAPTKTPTRVVIRTPTVIEPTPVVVLQAVSSVPVPGSQAVGLAWGRDWLWVSDALEQWVYAVDPTLGKALASFPTEASSPRGLAWDGESLWVADHRGKWLLYQLVPEKKGFVINVIHAPGKNSAPCGLAYGNKSLWVSHGCAKGDETDTIYQLDPWDGTIINAFPSPGQQPEGLAFGDGLLWSLDGGTGAIYAVDPETGEVLGVGTVSEARGMGSLVGLAFDGSYLWVSDTLNLYQLKPGIEYRGRAP